MDTVGYSDIKGYSKLFIDYIENYDNVSEFFNGNPNERQAWESQLSACDSHDYQREQLVRILLKHNRDRTENNLITHEIHKLLDSKCIAVVTGQQTGVFWGPLYTIYKALTAVRFARKLEQEYNNPVVPLFWMEVDDHDFEEIRHVYMMTSSGTVKRFDYSDEYAEKPVPSKFRSVVFDFNNLLNEIAENFGDGDYAKDIIDTCETVYTSGKCLTDCFVDFFREFFPDEPLIFLNPGDSAVKQLASPFFVRVLGQNNELHKQINTQTEALFSKTYSSQVTLRPDMYHLFRTDGKMRTRLNGFALGKDSADTVALTDAEIDTFVEEEVNSLSTDVLFRPLLQDYLLPTVAYIGGASEISYIAQLKKAYELLGLSMPILIPRWSATVIEWKNIKFLKKMKCDPMQIIKGNGQELLQELMKEVSGSSFDNQFENAFDQLQTRLEEIRKLGESLDSTLVKMVDKSEQKMKYQLEKIENRFHAALQTANKIAADRSQRALNAVIPNNSMQERTFSILHYMLRYGRDFPRFLSQQVTLQTNHHHIIEF